MGKKPKVPDPRVPFKGMVVSAVIALALTAWAVDFYREDQTFWLNARAVDAQVVSYGISQVCTQRSPRAERLEEPHDRNCSDHYRPTFQYVVHGQTHVATSASTFGAKFEKPSVVAAYDPDDPTKAELVAARSFVTFEVVFVGAFALCAWAIFVFYVKWWREEKKDLAAWSGGEVTAES